MGKLDLKKTHKNLYSANAEPAFVTVPKFRIFSVEGRGNPNLPGEFKDAVEALFPVAFKAKFICKKELGRDFVVMPLEGLWWTDDMRDFTLENKDIWRWQIFIVQPDFMTAEIFEKAKVAVAEKKDLPALDKVKFGEIAEGGAAQILHRGSYADEAPTIGKLHEFIEKEGASFDGLVQKHHEIYLSDMRKTAPEKLRTIIRQAVA